MKTYTKETLIAALLEIRAQGWIRGARPGNHGSIGNTLEDLLGIKENNLPLPNAAEWELKCHRIGTASLTTIFHTEPSPRTFRFVSQVFLPKYGWPHAEAGIRYPADEMSFRQTISGLSASDRGFRVVVDRDARKVTISFDASKVDQRHEQWLDSVSRRVGLGELSPQPYWGFDDLGSTARTKLLNCFFIGAEMKTEAGVQYFRYSTVMKLQGFSLNCLLTGIEKGYVYVDFDARTGHNHGTKFRLQQNMLPEMYETAVDLTAANGASGNSGERGK